jgi:hypothetical protein
VSIALIIVDMQRGMQATDPLLRNNLDAEKNVSLLPRRLASNFTPNYSRSAYFTRA